MMCVCKSHRFNSVKNVEFNKVNYAVYECPKCGRRVYIENATIEETDPYLRLNNSVNELKQSLDDFNDALNGTYKR